MLGKLIKHDLKALNRFMITIHAFLLIAAVLSRILVTGRIDFEDREFSGILLAAGYLLYILLIASASTATYLITGVQFYKNIYSDEGYLTNTLPVKRHSLLLSKTIAGGLWAVLDMLELFLCSYILIGTPFVLNSWKLHKQELFGILGFSGQDEFNRFALILLVFMLFSAFSSVIIIYASIVIGQLFSNHRILGAVVVYFSITLLFSLLSMIFFGITGIFSKAFLTATSGGNIDFQPYMMEIFKVTFILNLALIVVLYAVSNYLMSKKMNLS